MARILAIDYGKKRTGIAVTDPMGMIASPLETIRTHDVFSFLDNYLNKESVETIVIGFPTKMDNSPSEMVPAIEKFLLKAQKKYNKLNFVKIDERFTSKIAFQAMLDGGMKKNDRKDKANVDKISASIILQSFLEQKENNLF